jgi:hypothetical protein
LGAHYVPVPLPDSELLIALLREMDVIQSMDDSGHPVVREELLCRAPQERLFIAGQWQEGLFPRYGATAEDLKDLARFEAEVARWVAFRDEHGKRAFTVPSVNGSSHPDVEALDRLSMAEFLKAKGFTSKRLHWWVNYACRDDYGCSSEETSAYAGLFYFAARVDRPGDKGAEFITWPEGNGRLIGHLAKAAGKSVRLGTVALKVTASGSGASVLAWDARNNQLIELLADQVIIAAPRHVAHRLVFDGRGAPVAPKDGFTYSPWVVANLTLKDRPEEPGFPLAWDNVFYDSQSLGYVVATHQTGKDMGPTVWTYYLPLTGPGPASLREQLLGAPWIHWADAIVSDLRMAHHDIAEKIERLDVWRWGHAMVRPTVGFLRSKALEAARKPFGAVHFAHTDLSGMALFEEAQAFGVGAAKAVLSQRARASGGNP